MEYDVSRVVTTVEKKPIKVNDEGKEIECTYGRIFALALLGDSPDNNNLGRLEKVKRGKLAEKLIDAHKVNLTSDEVVMIKEAVSKQYQVMFVTRTEEFFEEQPVKEVH